MSVSDVEKAARSLPEPDFETMKNSRRNFLKTASLAAAAGGASVTSGYGREPASSKAKANFKIRNGNIRQSVMGWCFNDRFDKDPVKNAMQLARHCKEMGLVAMEGIPREAYPEVKKLGLEISLVGAHGFAKGPCNPEYHDFVVEKLTEGINTAADIGTKNVITFTGMRFDGMDDEDAAKRCVDTWKEVLSLAEKKGVTLVLEHLNSRDDTHPMKGHPGYFGDDVDFCVELIQRVGSENFKLLFDIYHVSIMNGDIIRRIRQYQDSIGHYHTAGNPGRAELDDNQEINYPPILREILKTGYTGFVAQEFIPTWEDAVHALRHAAEVCDV
jgi:hydroxypyruvate isomerase